jgi:formiminotetrahydrofolate cyclodeaminase
MIMTTTRLASRNFTQVLDQIAATVPSPGSGAAGALAVALGIACGTKAVRVSAKHQPQSTALPEAADALQILCAAVLELADADGTAFEQLLAAYRLPKTTPGAQQARRESIAAAAARAADVGEAIIDHARRAADILAAIKEQIHANVAGDFNAAQSLFAANQTVQQGNIAENRAIERRFRFEFI